MKKNKKSRALAGVLAAACTCAALPLSAASAVEIVPGDVIYETDFEDGIVDKFTGRGGVEVMEAVTDYANSGEYSMCVSGREKGWHGPQILLDEICEPNKEYTVSAFVRAEWYNDIKLSLEYTDADGVRHYSNLKSAVNQGDGWSEFSEVKFSFTDDVSKVYIYFEGNDAAKIWVDDFCLQEAPTIPIQEDIPSLEAVYDDYFKVGTAIMASNLASPSFMDLTEKHFSDSITFGNELKPDACLNQAACQAYMEENDGDDTNPQISLASAKSLLNYCAETGTPVRGHTLVWHSQTPDWFFKEGYADDGEWVTSEKMLLRMENYIKNLMEALATEYPDVEFYAWDVVNEAWLDSGVPRTAGEQGANGSNNSAWVQVFGDNSFIKYAFEYARKYAPEGCKLYYNDFNEYMPQKTDAIIAMAEELKAEGLIDGIGLQSHLDVGFPSVSVYEKAIAKFAETGLDIQVTELDITTSDTSETGLETQAQIYSDIFDVLVKYSDSISAVVLWGVTDDQSWRADRVPLLFDGQFQAKPAYYSIVDGMEVPPTEETTEAPTEETTEAPSEDTTTDTTATAAPDDIAFGDINGDAEVSILDVLTLNRNLLTGEPLSAAGEKCADVDGDGKPTASDALYILKFTIGVVKVLPIA